MQLLSPSASESAAQRVLPDHQGQLRMEEQSPERDELEKFCENEADGGLLTGRGMEVDNWCSRIAKVHSTHDQRRPRLHCRRQRRRPGRLNRDRHSTQHPVFRIGSQLATINSCVLSSAAKTLTLNLASEVCLRPLLYRLRTQSTNKPAAEPHPSSRCPSSVMEAP
jgi:hypothetical protein